MLMKNYLWLLPFYMVVAIYVHYEKVRTKDAYYNYIITP